MTASRHWVRLALSAALAGMPAAAAAQNGAGTQSMFASGYGNRALAMGSASVAGADDPSALCWNAAGLASLTSCHLQFAQSNGIGLGLHEAVLAMGVPDWRWGTAAFSVRTFGINDLEQRDDRNRLVSGDLSDRELEVALGYAKTVGPALSLGAALKTQRQAIGGLDALGVGVDAGVRFVPGRISASAPSWADRLTFGLAIRNLVQPALRLDRESVADPAVLRSGLAWHGPLGVAGDAVVEIDVEHVNAGGTGLRSGIEVRPSPLMALRAGMDGGSLTAGTGFAWRRLGIDYAYLDNPVAAEHRIELSYAFGRDVNASRIAAQHKEDQKLQARLEEVYRQRRDSEIAELLGRAETARAAGHWDEALEALGSARTLAPDDSKILGLEVTCLKAKASTLRASGDFAAAALAYDLALETAPADSEAAVGARLARAASDARAARSGELRARFARALDAFGEGRLLEARRTLTELLALAPADSDAIGMLRRTDLAIARAATQALDRADEALKDGRPSDALEALQFAEKLDPASPGIATRRAECVRLLRSQTSARASAPRAAAPQASAATGSTTKTMDPRELDRLYRRGVIAQNNGQIDEAVRCWELVQSASPGYRGVDAFLTREYLTRGMDAFSAGRLNDAIRDWELVLRINPNDSRARGYVDRAREQAARRREILGVR